MAVSCTSEWISASFNAKDPWNLLWSRLPSQKWANLGNEFCVCPPSSHSEKSLYQHVSVSLITEPLGKGIKMAATLSVILWFKKSCKVNMKGLQKAPKNIHCETTVHRFQFFSILAFNSTFHPLFEVVLYSTKKSFSKVGDSSLVFTVSTL